MMNPGRHPLADRQVFRRRLIGTGRLGLGLIAISLAIGVAGYALTENLSILDAFLNASMILGGMGPIGELRSNASKIFAGLFALYSGLLFLAVTVVLLTPIFHRLLHRFHWEAGKSH
jgi:hypothetical protein